MTRIELKTGEKITTKLTVSDILNQLSHQTYIVIADNDCIIAETEFNIIYTVPEDRAER